MNRREWIDERRAAVVAEYDADAATYDQYPYPNDVQQKWVRRLLLTCPAGGLVLDAACGTGQYIPLVAEAGVRVVGIDQSEGMLALIRWIETEGLDIVSEGFNQEEGWGYRHFLLRSRPSAVTADPSTET